MNETDDPLGTLKQELLLKWDGEDEGIGTSHATFESDKVPRRTRGGFAIGHSINPKNGEPRLEIRVTAESGPNHKRAKAAILRHELARGMEVIWRVAKKPQVPDPPAPTPQICGRCSPLHIGASVAHQESSAGTLGAFVRLQDGRHGIVSCGHVLARLNSRLTKKKWGGKFDPVHNPGWPDEDPVPIDSRIGRLENFAPFVDGRGKNLDAAVAALDEGVVHMGNVLPDLPCVGPEFRGRPIGSEIAASELTTGMRVVKLGRTTGMTEGSLEAIHFVNERVDFGTGSYTFFGLHEVRWDEGWENDKSKHYAAAGDSGSLVLTKDGLHPIGLHFASRQVDTYRASYVVAWSKIATTFKLNLL